MKKFCVTVFLLMIIFAQASAMRLELDKQPIGKISFSGESFQFEGASKISKNFALFGDELYFHFDAANKITNFGDRKIKNTVKVDILGETEIYRINNTAGADLFLLHSEEIGTGDGIKVIGTRGGKWLEHLDALSLREKYDIGWNFHMSKFFTEDNKIIFRYTLQDHFIDVICRYHAVNEKFYTEVIEQ